MNKYRKNVTSQNGEDGVIEQIFKIIKPINKTFVDVGAWDGKHLSNTWNIRDWNGILIEMDNNKCMKVKRNIVINKEVNFEGENSLDNILRIRDFPAKIDLITIDIDGNDYHVWDSLKNFQPQIVIIEFNPTFPNDKMFIQPRDMKISQGSSLYAMVSLGKEKGYELIAVTNINAFFVKKELFKKFKIKDNSIDTLNKDANKYQTKVAQLYDGKLMIIGNTKRLCKTGELIIK